MIKKAHTLDHWPALHFNGCTRLGFIVPLSSIPVHHWCYRLGMKRDRIQTDITYITFVFIFLSRIWIRMWIVSNIPNRIRLDIDVINMRFEYSDTNTDTVSDVGYPDSDTDRSQPL